MALARAVTRPPGLSAWATAGAVRGAARSCHELVTPQHCRGTCTHLGCQGGGKLWAPFGERCRRRAEQPV